MLHASRPRWRLFCLQLGCVLLALLTRGIAQAPTLTTVAEVRWSDSVGAPTTTKTLPDVSPRKSSRFRDCQKCRTISCASLMAQCRQSTLANLRRSMSIFRIEQL